MKELNEVSGPSCPVEALVAEHPENAANDIHVIHAPIMREKDRPSDGNQPIPLVLIFAFGALLLWGGWYLGAYSGGFAADVFDPRESGRPALAAEPAPVDLVAVGRRVYASCSACHQGEGQGLAGAYPPLAGSEWVTGDPDTLIRILLHGMQGRVEVRGQSYNGLMPAWGRLGDEELAGVMTYIRGAWGNGAPPVEPADVAKVRAETDGRKKPWTAASLLGRNAGDS